MERSTIEEVIAALRDLQISHPGIIVTDSYGYPLTVRFLPAIEGEEARVEVGR